MTPDEVTARTQGRTAGEDLDRRAGDCPYPHSKINLRLAWMDGFGEGRKGVAHHAAERTARPARDGDEA